MGSFLDIEKTYAIVDINKLTEPLTEFNIPHQLSKTIWNLMIIKSIHVKNCENHLWHPQYSYKGAKWCATKHPII